MSINVSRETRDMTELGFRAANAIAWENQHNKSSARNGIALRVELAQWAAADVSRETSAQQ